jgi:predicted DNA-binding WGR domain protein
MSEWTVDLELEDDTSSKFWRARVEGKTLYVSFGKIGTAGQTQVRELASAAEAQKELDKLIRDKRKKGYEDAAGADEDDEDADEDEADEDEDGDDEASDDEASGGLHLVLDAGKRQVETRLHLDGKTVRMDSTQTYASPEAAKQAYERLEKALIGDGYQKK